MAPMEAADVSQWDDVVREPRVDSRWRLGDRMRDTTGFLEGYPALPASVAEARRALEAWLEREGVGGQQLEDVRLAVSEAATNAVVHAYGRPARSGSFELAATIVSGALWVIVSDAGSGFRAHGNTGGLGLGLSLIAKLADAIDLVSPEDGGFELRMRFDL